MKKFMLWLGRKLSKQFRVIVISCQGKYNMTDKTYLSAVILADVTTQ